MTESGQSELPPQWCLARLEDIAAINPKLDKSDISDDLEVSFVPMPAVEAETGAINVGETRRFCDVKKGYTSFREDDVLFAKITPCMENGKMAVVPAVTNGLGFGSTEFHVIRPREGILPEYLYYFVSSARFRYDAEHNMTGAVGQRRVPATYLSQHPIPLAPLEEQQRIVAKIEQLFSELNSGVESLELVREQLKAYYQAVLKHAFEGKLTEQWRAHRSVRPWEATTLGEQLSFLTSGSRGWAKFYAEKGDLFIRAQNLKHDRLDLTDAAFVDLPKKSEGMRTRVHVGDLLITITGANVTKTAFVASNLHTAYVSQHVALARPVKGINTEFLYWYLVAEAAGRKQLKDMAYGAGKPGLNLENIRSVTIELPDPLEQEEIVSQINSALAIEQNARSHVDNELERCDLLREAILTGAFAGQLAEQDSNDEPAPVLLDRIGAGTDSHRRKPNKTRKTASANAKSRKDAA